MIRYSVLMIWMLIISSGCSYEASNQTEADSLTYASHQAVQSGAFDSLTEQYAASFISRFTL